MNIKRVASTLGVLAILGMFLLPKLARGQTGIIVNNADSVSTIDTTSSQDLENTTSSVTPRNVVQYSDSMRHFDFIAMPAALQSLANTVTPRNVVQYADSIRDFDLAAMPAALQTLANTVTPRNVVQYSDSIRDFNLAAMPAALQALANTVTPRNVVQYSDSTATYALGYPLTLMNDTVAPQISAVGDSAISGDAVVITWTTDEFADGEVVYGTQSGAYTLSASSLLFVKRHAITLTQLTADTTYYYKTRSTDQSGNTAQSAEYDFTVQSQKYIYLPVVLK